MPIRKLLTLSLAEAPTKVQTKLRSVVLGDSAVKFLTRSDVKAIEKSDALAKAPNSAKFLNEVRRTAKSNGAYYIRVS